MEVVGYDDLMVVSFEGGAGFRYQKSRVCLELEKKKIGRLDESMTLDGGGEGITLKETIYPSRVHSSTIGFKTLGTWCISIDRFPLPDWILCSDFLG